MAIGIIGLPQSGKTSVFNAATRGHAQTVAGRGAARPNVGVAKVPDHRLDRLAEIVHPRRLVPAEVEFIDIPDAPDGFGKSQGIGGELLNVLQGCDALALVARAFENAAVPHSEGSVDPHRDVANMQLEMAFSDMAILERRERRIQDSMKGAKAAQRDLLVKEGELVQLIRQGLESDVPVREQPLPSEAKTILDNFQLLTAKPLLVLFNIGEGDLPQLGTLDAELQERLGRPSVEAAGICGKLEMELAQMPPEEEEEFRASLQAGESGLERMVRLSYRLLGLISFLTMGEDEARAWPITAGITALEAAAKVHSDIQRGFIRAELVAFDDLDKAGTLAEARRLGVLRSEGKQYVVRDGDVINFLFNV